MCLCVCVLMFLYLCVFMCLYSVFICLYVWYIIESDGQVYLEYVWMCGCVYY